MKGLRPEAIAALEPVRASLRATATAQAQELASAAAAESGELVRVARERAAEIVASAAAEGAAAAGAAAALRSARARREANELVLAEQEALRRQVLTRLVHRAQQLSDDPRHEAWLEDLARRCRELLGPGAVVTPSPDGGVVGVLGSLRLDLSIPVLAAASVEAHAEEVRQLWAP